MSIVKNVSGPYTINTIDKNDPIILDSNVVIIKGNLTVIGNSASITSNNTSITDNIITLNAGYVGATPLPIPAGLEVVRGGDISNPDVYLRWNEASTSWQVTNNGSTFYNIVATTTGNTRVVDDPSPQLGGNLFTNGNWITDSTGAIKMDPATNLQIDGNVALKMFTSAPPALPNYNILHAGNVAAGGTGLYVTSAEQNIVGEELISKRKAIVYSIIF